MLRARALRRWGKRITAVAGAVLLTFQAVGGSTGKVDIRERVDLIEIRGGQGDGDSEMPAVVFMHDRHTEAIGDASCARCHSDVDGRTVFRFKRTGSLAPKRAKDHYHDNCIACHRETQASGKPSGPLTADCRSCHRQEAPASKWAPIAFDASLHYRHERARSIHPDPAQDNCGACHHVYDPKAEKTVAVRGEEGSCRYCHKETATMDKDTHHRIRPLREAAHDSCVACHQQLASLKAKGGPVTCAKCHDKAEQGNIETVAQVPRMRRNQPDAVLLATRLKAAAAAGKVTDEGEPAPAFVAAVAFDHRGHEMAVGSCRSCHHASLARCAACHTLSGDEKGGFVRLEQAMHGARDNASCIRCHDRAKTAATCAGCHGQLPKKNFTDADCRLCHDVDLTPGAPALQKEDAAVRLAAGHVAARAKWRKAVAKADIPQTVRITAMADQYQGAVLPHGKIVQALADNLGDSALARHFHGESTTLCQGCHHHSPPSLKPPRCASCHGAPFAGDAENRPGLMGAYHGQCMGCHEKMGIAKPAANDCTACHQKRATLSAKGQSPQ